MSASVKIVSTLLSIRWKGKHKGSRSFPSVHPSAVLNTRNKFQSRILATSAVSRSSLNFAFEANWRHRATEWRSLAARAST
jgi:hypothetical protein